MDNTENSTYCQRHNGSAKEAQQVCHAALPAGHSRDRAHGHEDDGHDDGRQRIEGTGQLTVGFNQLLIGNSIFFMSGIISCGNVLADIFGKAVAGKQRENGYQSAHTHNQQHIIADAQRVGCGNRTGGGRNENVRNIKTGA